MSVLGLLIYIIYVNDIMKVLDKDYTIYLYADHMLITYHNIDVDIISERLQRMLNCIMKWCSDNKLTVNLNKTKFMLVSSTKAKVAPILYVDRSKLAAVSQYEYLGMLLDNKLSMNHQVDTCSMYKKANSRLPSKQDTCYTTNLTRVYVMS